MAEDRDLRRLIDPYLHRERLRRAVFARDLEHGVLSAIDLPRERRLVQKALAGLPDEQRDVIQRMYFDGMSQSQIAERTGLPLGTVKSRTLLAMRRLRTHLGEVAP